ncbi:pyridoxal-phosphate-dependent aminotransferase family protein [Staphylococcus lutrae]|uniref:Aminotransferase class V n=1 Tax=Staphylococcus lutrae TaxID=155085 RepID=A0AAC9WLL6_9STAP|nr:alanine--glyoxylate aminotransferase family protein [Staphylococcus lutrae]ARJ50012.1 aminotransferase class V [Staphylococcus lutrae]PNZ36403.1 alanine--glyoxylate aminotransferase family protein [Staphylococcus lutrae]
MYTHHSLLLTPGPTPIPLRIQAQMNQPMMGHRSSDFEKIAAVAFHSLKPMFGSQNDVMILTSSGTSALEASMLNIVNPEDHIVIIVSGAFGQRFKQIAETYFNHVHTFEVEWGQAFDVSDVMAFIKGLDVSITAVFSQYCETSTAVLHPVAELGQQLKKWDNQIYFVVDGVSCIGAVDVHLERDGIDVLVSGSQKALMLPPGIAFVAYNDRALERFKSVTTPRFYLSLVKHHASLVAHSTPFTPNISAIRGVIEYAQMVEEEGFDHVIQRHYHIRDAVRAALRELDLALLVEDTYASPTVTAFVPNDKDELTYIKNELKNQFNITIAGGQGKLKGHILRVGHMGFLSPFDLLPFVAALEVLLTQHRQNSYIGRATKAFMEVIHHAL